MIIKNDADRKVYIIEDDGITLELGVSRDQGSSPRRGNQSMYSELNKSSTSKGNATSDFDHSMRKQKKTDRTDRTASMFSMDPDVEVMYIMYAYNVVPHCTNRLILAPNSFSRLVCSSNTARANKYCQFLPKCCFRTNFVPQTPFTTKL